MELRARPAPQNARHHHRNRRLNGMARHWHLLSLDAPTVAALWAWFFGRWLRVPLPPLAIPLLALGTWLFYVTDRLLDGHAAALPQERHRFHRRHHRGFLMVALPMAVLLAMGVWRWLPRAELRAYAVLGVVGLLYLLWVHRRRAAPPAATAKATAVAVVFALATGVPAWASAGPKRPELALGVALFAGACWLNCFAIDVWEQPEPGNGQTVAWTAAALAASAAVALPRPPALAVLLAALLFLALHLRRRRLSALHLRIAADLALLTPLFWLRWR